jgi:hypothetical protein
MGLMNDAIATQINDINAKIAKAATPTELRELVKARSALYTEALRNTRNPNPPSTWRYHV